MTQKLKFISFGSTATVTLLLMAGTLLEKTHGTDFVTTHIYASPLFILLWGVVGISSLLYLIRRGVHRQMVTFWLHLSFLLILAGAFITHLVGIQGNIHLRQGESPTCEFKLRNGEESTFPFSVALKHFELAYYPGTVAPMDFISTLTIQDKGTETEGKVSMNHIYSHRYYRFYQSTYDADGKGSTLSISYDPYGIAVTYLGYTSLLFSLFAFLFAKGSQFRKLCSHPLLRKGGISLLLCLILSLPVQAKESEATLPPTLSAPAAQAFGHLYIYYNDRICPLQTFAKDFTLKLYGKPSYKGFSAEQVLAGWLFYYDHWKEEPMIRIKSSVIQQQLGATSEWICLSHFIGKEGYKLEQLLRQTENIQARRSAEEANEKFNLISMVCTGSLLKIFPYHPVAASAPVWYASTDELPADMPQAQWSFIRHSINYLAEKIAHHKDKETIHILQKIRSYQQREAHEFLPSDKQFKAEKLYNRLYYTGPIAMSCVTIGILMFIFFCRNLMTQPSTIARTMYRLSAILLAAIGLYLLLTLFLRGYISNHLPLSNGYETMQFMALCCIAITWSFRRRFIMALPFGFLTSGLALLVSMLGEANPSVTQLMPVLASPLLSLHVATIMLAYSLLAFIMLNGCTALIIHCGQKEQGKNQIYQLYLLSQLLLYPAVFLLAIGIFIGAVWANVSWGRYWGWDPKEVWALITMLVYASALHSVSLDFFRRPLRFHLFSILAFLCVLITYFGVNFILGGMHSYA